MLRFFVDMAIQADTLLGMFSDLKRERAVSHSNSLITPAPVTSSSSRVSTGGFDIFVSILEERGFKCTVDSGIFHSRICRCCVDVRGMPHQYYLPTETAI